jgi:hypothetical protein
VVGTPTLTFSAGTEDGDASVETVTPADSLPAVSDDDEETGLEGGYARGKKNGGVNELDFDDDGDDHKRPRNVYYGRTYHHLLYSRLRASC